MIPIRRHDRYVLGAFWGAFAAVMLFFSTIVILVYLADRGAGQTRNFPQLREAGYQPVLLVVEYYATLMPFLTLHIVPLAAVLAAAFGLSRLTRHNELSPLVAAGVSTRRVTVPIVISGLLLSTFLFVLQERYVPRLSRRHMQLDRLLTDSEPDRITEIPHFDDPGGARLSVAALQPTARRLESAMLTIRGPDGAAQETRFYPLLDWDEETTSWIAVHGGRRFPLEGEKTGRIWDTLPEGEAAPLEAHVRLLEVSVMKDLSLGLSAGETSTLLQADPDNPRLALMYHRTMAQSLAPLVLLLVGLPFCLRLGRPGALAGTIAVLSGGAALYSLGFLTSRLATSGELNPMVMAWLPTVLVGCVGLALWLSMRS